MASSDQITKKLTSNWLQTGNLLFTAISILIVPSLKLHYVCRLHPLYDSDNVIEVRVEFHCDCCNKEKTGNLSKLDPGDVDDYWLNKGLGFIGFHLGTCCYYCVVRVAVDSAGMAINPFSSNRIYGLKAIRVHDSKHFNEGVPDFCQWKQKEKGKKKKKWLKFYDRDDYKCISHTHFYVRL